MNGGSLWEHELEHGELASRLVDEDARSDSDLIGGSLEDAGLFGEIFSRHYEAVFRFAARRVGVEDAGDVASEVFVRAFRIRSRYDTSRSGCLPWLYGIAANVVGDRIRKRRRGQRRFLVADPTAGIRFGMEDSEDRMVAESLVGRLNDALGRLSAGDRETFLLHALEGLSYSEIGVALGIPAGTVGSRITRSRRKLRELIPDLEQITDRMDDSQRRQDPNDV